MPLVSRVVEMDGCQMLDGGIADSLPLRYFEKLGYEKNLVILTQPAGYCKKKNRALPLIRLGFRRYPQMVKALTQRHEKYNEDLSYIEKREKEGAAFIPVSYTHLLQNTRQAYNKAYGSACTI